MSIPLQFLSKMGHYEVELHGIRVKASVIDDSRMLWQSLPELRSSLQHRRLMGLECKSIKGGVEQLLLCAGKRCLIIQAFLCEEASLLLGDDTICFVGRNMSSSISQIDKELCKSRSGHLAAKMCKSGVEIGHLAGKIKSGGVEIGHLAAKILKKPILATGTLTQLAGEVGLDIKPLTAASVPAITNIQVFTEEEIKHAIYDVYTSYLIGDKLLGML